MSLTDGLNEAQKLAVTAEFGPVLVLAGPGSGKTRVLTHRIAYLMAEMGVRPYQILAVTFTNKAAREMRNRVEAIVDGELSGTLVGTFHSVCVRLLRRESANLAVLGYSSDFVIFDADDQIAVVKQVLKELNIDDKKFKPRTILGDISNAKDAQITPDLLETQTYKEEVLRRVYTEYQETLIANNAMDFDDLLLNMVRLLDERPDLLEKYQNLFQYILVDEFQDTNSVQYGLLKRLAGGHRNLFAVGDSDQSIYKWRGADIRNLANLRRDFPEVVQILLEQNYRSTQTILDAAKAVIQHNHDRVHKDLFTDREGGANITIHEAYNETEEADYVVNKIAMGVVNDRNPRDFAVMYRTNAQSRALEEAFLRQGLPYRLVGGTRFYSRREIRDVIAYLRLIANPRDDVAFRRVIGTPPRGIGLKTVSVLAEWGKASGLQAGEAVMMLAIDESLTHPFKGRALSALTRFGNLLNGWLIHRENMPVGDLVKMVLEQVQFQAYLDDGTAEGRDRWANVLELIGVAESEENMKLPAFLEQVALVADVDALDDGDGVNAPTLMTLHSSKGLEFPVVFITGCEDGILPHSRTFDDPDEMAEERRLFYVGITRAEDELHLLRAFRRTVYGMSDATVPSRFLADLPDELLDGGKGIRGQRQEAKQRMSRYETNSARIQHTRPRRVISSETYMQKKEMPTPRHVKPERTEREKVVAQFKTGQNVKHEKFGEGTVITSKVTGADEVVEVAFKGVGVKKLSMSFTSLEVI